MRYLRETCLFLLFVAYAMAVYQAGVNKKKFLDAQRELEHLQAIQTATVKQCGEAWLKTPIEKGIMPHE